MRLRTPLTGAAGSAPVIIEAEFNGAMPETVNPNVPVTEDEIFADVLACPWSGN
jgi:uncharacterized protein (DUF849 family)